MALQEVTVISHHSHTHKDKHLGVSYEFPPNKKVLIPLAAAAHFFGVGLPANSPARMKAWQRHGFTNAERGEAYLKKFEMKVVDLVPEETTAEDLKAEHKTELDELQAAHDEKIATLEKEHANELDRVNASHAEEVNALKTRIAELEAAASDGKTAKGKK